LKIKKLADWGHFKKQMFLKMIEFFFKGQLNKIIKLRKLNLVNDMGKVFGIIALVCGILSFVGWFLASSIHLFFFFGLGYFWLPGVAIILGFIGTHVDEPKTMAWVGFILGLLGLSILPTLYMLLGLAIWD
jgi:hypothetical protein